MSFNPVVCFLIHVCFYKSILAVSQYPYKDPCLCDLSGVWINDVGRVRLPSQFVADLSFGNISSSSALSVMSKSSGHEIFISAAFFKTLATVLLDTLQLFAMFRSLNPNLCKRRISRYLSIIVTSFTCIHTNGVYLQYKGNICNKAFKCGSELPEHVALILRNGGSESPGIISSVSA